MWQARTKADLIIEVWEQLDCENVGARELIAIEDAVRKRFGPAAIDSPMVLARKLADEGAELRHAEIMELYVERRSDQPYEPVFRNVLKFTSLRSAARIVRDLENIRKRFVSENDKEGIRLLRQTVIEAKQKMLDTSAKAAKIKLPRDQKAEIAAWLTLWLQTPEMFETWLSLRRRSQEFIDKFGGEFVD